VLDQTPSVFPSDERTLEYLRSVGRKRDWRPIAAEEGAQYELHDEIDLSSLQPLVAKPPSPANVVLVREVAGADIYQAYIGSSAKPGFRDFAIAATIVRGREVHDRVSFDINPSSRHILQTLAEKGYLTELVAAGARAHQPGCNGCITDPRDLGISYERIKEPERFSTSNKRYSATNGRQALNGRHQPLHFLSVKTQTSTLARIKI
jgi:aconitate hydratase